MLTTLKLEKRSDIKQFMLNNLDQLGVVVYLRYCVKKLTTRSISAKNVYLIRKKSALHSDENV